MSPQLELLPIERSRNATLKGLIHAPESHSAALHGCG